MKRLIRKILREQFNYKEKIFKLLNSGQDENIEMVKYLSEGQGYDLIDLLIEYFQEYGPPYLNIFNVLEIPEEEQEFILSKIFGTDIIINERGNIVRNDKGRTIYYESSDGGWEKMGYNDNGNEIYFGDSSGFWEKRELDDNGNEIYYESSDGFWQKNEYDDNGNRIYQERSDGFWWKWEYGDNGDMLYYENSNGDIKDNR